MDMTRAQQVGDHTGSAMASVDPAPTQAGAPSAGERADRAAAAAGANVEATTELIRERTSEMSPITTLVDRLGDMGTYFRDRRLSGALDDLEAVIRRHPVQSLVVGFGLGYLLAKITMRS
jgi:hypothetical protein